MDDPLAGIMTISLCGLFYWFSWRQFKNQKITLAVALLMLCGLILRLYVSADFFLHIWDERYHALVAKNLLNHPLIPTLYDDPVMPYDFKNWTANHIWVHKQPLPLWTIAMSLWLFGVNEIALRLPSVILTSIGILLTFQIGKILFNQKVGFIAAFLYSIHGLIIEVTSGRVATDHIDVFFLFFIELAVFLSLQFAIKRKVIFNVLCGISIGAAILTKWLPALIVLPIWLLLVINFRKFTVKKIVLHFLILCITIMVISLPWQIYIQTTFPMESIWESSFNIKHITEVIEERDGPFYFHFDKMRILYGELIYIPFVWFFYKTFKKWGDPKRWALLIWILIPFLFFSVARTKMQAYTLFTAPAIFIITALFWQFLYIYRNRFKYKWIINIVLFLIIALPIRYSIERIKPFESRDRNPQWVQDLKHLNKIYNGKKNIIFNVDYPIETMFYTDFIAYETIPNKNTIEELKLKGYNIYINDNEDLTDELKNLKDIEIIKITGHNNSNRCITP